MSPFSSDPKRGHDGRSRGTEIASEDFLFHLYRGSELLQDNRVHEAKEELEMAIRLQPLDPQGQDLLGVVYFRLGMYPRAIEIFEQLVREYPEERTPRINLALCYLKTGQAMNARQLLEETVMLHPDNTRAWGYLGLAFERLGDYMKAREAFLRGGQEGMARRMDELLREQVGQPPRSRRASTHPPEPFRELPEEEALTHPPSVPPPPVSLGAARLPSLLPPAISEPPALEATQSLLPAVDFARQRLLIFPGNGAVQHETGLLLLSTTDGFACRQSALRGLVASSSANLQAEPLPRVFRGKPQEEPLGGAVPLLGYSGANRLVLGPSGPGVKLHAFLLRDEMVCLREDLLVGFDSALSYENGRLAMGDGEAALMVQLQGTGPVVLETRYPLGALEVLDNEAITVRRELVVGWHGRLIPRAILPSEAPAGQRGLVSFSGEGSLLVQLP
ncbi:MAG: tetratricopeptide repeat protein [Myxococcales bacterium]|nr:tetratricopeptide repeat protein [Polyangiaceae bacterium]MDW8250571.1 tetratricopeptide repeat protein [Myxococcales bacterium]